MNDENSDSKIDQTTDFLNLETIPAISFEERPAPPALLHRADGLTLRPFSLLRSKVQQKLAERDVSLIGVTSPTPNVGKTTLSIALASSLERVVDRPVILADLDLRRASVAEYLGLDVGCGLSDYLADPTVSLQSVAIGIAETDLIVLPTNSVSQASAELLSGKGLKQLTTALRAHPGRPICIVDLPPAFASDDTIISLGLLDGYFLVVENGKTTKKQILDVLKMLAPSKCFGTILNQYDGTIGDSYSYGSAEYSNYYE